LTAFNGAKKWEIARGTVEATGLALDIDRFRRSEKARDPRWVGHAPYTRHRYRENHARAIGLFERALALDPHSAEAQSGLAWALAGRVLANMTDSPVADLERASQLSAQALAAAPGSPVAHMAKGDVLRAQRRYPEAIPEYETALALDWNAVYAYFALGQCKPNTGSIEETIPLVERAIRLSPRDPGLGIWYNQIGYTYLLQSRTDEAVRWLEKARDQNPAHSMIRGYLAAAYGLAGETERAAAELAEARRLSPDDRYSSIAHQRLVWSFGVPKIRALVEATYFAGLRKAGMPEEWELIWSSTDLTSLRLSQPSALVAPAGARDAAQCRGDVAGAGIDARLSHDCRFPQEQWAT
jgi:adenylate cyclase